MAPVNPRWVRTDAELASFRANELTVDVLYARLELGNVLVNVDAGVGKSHLVARLIDQHLDGRGRYDLVIYLAARLDVLHEQPFVSAALAGADTHTDVAVLRARPAAACGRLDKPWRKYEIAGCAIAGRNDLCERCPNRKGCAWPTQLYKERLEGKRVIAAAQAYVQVMPDFVRQMISKTGAGSALVILDEAAILDMKLAAHISARDIDRSLAVIYDVQRQSGDGRFPRWIELHMRLRDPTRDLRRLPSPRPLDEPLLAMLQATAMAKYGATHRFLLFEIARLWRSRRWRNPEGGVDYVRRPDFADARYAVLGAGVSLDLARHRLQDDQLHELHPNVRFLHERSRVFNIRSKLGAACNFRHNAPQVLFAIAGLIAKLAAEGKRSIVVAKQKFVSDVATMLEDHLRRLSGAPYRVVPEPTTADIADPYVVPILHFGITGVNMYEAFDVAIACTSFLTRSDVIEEHLNDGAPSGDEIEVEFAAGARHRRARPRDHWARQQGYGRLIDSYQHHLEAAWVEQALGRVRFAVRPRLVVFFQQVTPRFPVEQVFESMSAFRRYFGLRNLRAFSASNTNARVLAAVGPGMTAEEVAARARVSRATVFRHLAAAGISLTTPNSSSCRLGETDPARTVRKDRS